MEIRYPATVTAQADGSLFVQFIDLPDTFTEGQTKEEALFNAAEVLSAMLAWRLDEAKDVPAPSLKVKGAHYIAPDAKTQAAMLLRLARGDRTGIGAPGVAEQGGLQQVGGQGAAVDRHEHLIGAR